MRNLLYSAEESPETINNWTKRRQCLTPNYICWILLNNQLVIWNHLILPLHNYGPRLVTEISILESSVADPIRFRIRIRGSGFQNTDPDPGDPKKTGSDRIRILLSYVFDV